MIPSLGHFRSHQHELRHRLICCFVALILSSTLSYLFKDSLAAWCMRPLYLAYPELGKLVYTNLTEAFLSYIKLSLFAGFSISFPFILQQIWMFIAPGLLEKEKRLASQIILWATLLFVSGAAFAFFIVLPRLLHYFMSYAGPGLIPMLKLGQYLGFIGRMQLTFALAFEIPFLMVMANRLNLIRRDYFGRKRLYFYAAIVALAYLLSAGEPSATVLLSGPLFLLYEAGILAGRIFSRAQI